MKALKRILALCGVCLMITGGAATAQQDEASDMKWNAKTKVSDVVNDPAFEGFGSLLFPSRYGGISAGMTLDGIDVLLPYHNDIRTETTLDVLHALKARAQAGETIFYSIYTEEEKQADPAKAQTGLFFFKGEPGAPFAIVNAGGGFSYVGSIHESLPHALHISRAGYNGFALAYRTGGANVACEDLARAITFIFHHAQALEVSTDGYSLWGGSAGARMAAYLGSHGPEAFGGDGLPRPSTVVMQYTGHSDYTPDDPATYVCIGENDGIADWRTMQRRVKMLSSLGIDTAFHLYPNLGHGFGLGIGTTAQGWIDDAIAFWEAHMEEFAKEE